MNWILKSIISLWFLKCIFLFHFFAFGEKDQNCLISTCECCFDRVCAEGRFFENECSEGCIDGHRGARCYELCIDSCKSCPDSVANCTSCYDGFYLEETHNCTNCPSNCKSCSSSTNCRTCKEGFRHTAGSFICDSSICAKNCECNQDNCISCKNGYYDTKELCKRACPITCTTCTSSEVCGECKNGYYNGYGHFGGNNIWLNNCTHRCKRTCELCSSYDICLQCIVGKYGKRCEENCPAGCSDNICLINTGKCKAKDMTANISMVLVVTIASLATLLVLAATGLCILLIKKKVMKMRSAQRRSEESVPQIHFENALAANQNSQNEGETVDSVDGTDEYQNTERNKDVNEHMYDAANSIQETQQHAYEAKYQNTTETQQHTSEAEYQNTTEMTANVESNQY